MLAGYSSLELRGSDRNVVRVAAAMFLLFFPTTVFAQSEKRIALLIGNRAYDASVGVLKNPHNDIALVGEALAKQGFEVLPTIKDARRSAILSAVRELARRLNSSGAGAIGFPYYSGHGAAEKDTNVNYLIPIDASDPSTSAFWDDSIKLDDILKLLDGARSAAKFRSRCLSQRAAAADERYDEGACSRRRAAGYVHRICQRPGPNGVGPRRQERTIRASISGRA
jgi:caspase domain-containing protein